jgi:concanavalin A-like lectin/glucanase superfamily protein
MSQDSDGLIGHWPLSDGVEDHGPYRLATRAENVVLGAHMQDGTPSARFDGRSSRLRVEDHDALHFGTGDVSLAAWIDTDSSSGDVGGDLISKFDPSARRGIHLSIITNGGENTVSQANYRNLHFGIDAARIESDWRSCGVPGNAAWITTLTVSNNALYAGTFEQGAGERGHLWRYEGDNQWTDLGNPVGCNSISSVAEHNGELYVGTGRYNPDGSMMGGARNRTAGGRVFRLGPDGGWMDAGHPGAAGATPEEQHVPGFFTGKADEASALMSFQGNLYCTSYHRRGVYRYDGGESWTPVGLEDKYVLSLVVYRHQIYALLNEGELWRTQDGSTWVAAGHPAGSVQNYSGVAFRGDLYVGTWPNAEVFRLEGDDTWQSVGRVGAEREVMGMVNYNGKVYLGSLPMANVWRMDDDDFAFLGTIDHASAPMRRAWSFAVYQGRLFVGTLPSGNVCSIEAGKMASWDTTFPVGRHHVAAVKHARSLRLYLDGRMVSESSAFSSADFDLSNETPLTIGYGAYEHFTGLMSDVRLYRRTLSDVEIQHMATD